MLCSVMDSLYFYGLLALGGLCAHLYEYPPTNSTLSSIWAPTVRRTPLTLTLNLISRGHTHYRGRRVTHFLTDSLT